MGLTPLKGLLFLSGAVVAGLGAAYVLGAFDTQEPRPAALSSSPSPDTGAPAATAKQDEQGAGAATREARLEDAGQENASEPVKPAQEIAPPTFDIVRVEPNGSMVIAGKAEPNARVEIINGSTVLGTATSGASGDFAAVLEEPLEPGDYQIVLRATTPDNLAATSLETAIVTVPDDEAGQVLALVDQPGAPSRLITVPEAKAPQESESETQAELASEPSATAPTGQEQPATAEKPQGEPAPVATEAEGEKPAEAAQTEEQSPPATTAAEAAGSPFIEAVEIDGRQVFVAGAARPGSTIRVYVNQILLGETVTTPNGRFLIEATRELPIGDYIVRADMLSDDGRTVVARAAVPFTRAEGEQVAAVAAPDSGSDVRNDAVDGKDARLPSAEASQPAQEPEAAAEATSPDAKTTAPKLAPVDGSVIIRRGDTLWHISRRVYGRGIRYTTLYLANQDQIEDPDRIWPGQVFAVPESTEEGEAADMEAIEDQMVKPENAN